MASDFETTVKKYQDALKDKKKGMETSFGRTLWGRNGVPTRFFWPCV
jgi:hypothetical protein